MNCLNLMNIKISSKFKDIINKISNCCNLMNIALYEESQLNEW